MGNTSSDIPAGQGSSHSGIPQDVVPYTGPLQEYRTLLVRSKLIKGSFFGGTTSDVNEYMGTLAQQYAEYFKLDTFFRVPYSMQSAGLTTVIMSYQAIFSRPAVYVPSPESWQLQVVPTKLTMSAGQIDTIMVDIYNILAQKAALGGRLICLECNGETKQGGFVSTHFGINLFFNIASHPNPVLYTNIAYCAPMQIMHSSRDIDIQMDIIGTLSLHLDQGWKLIDIICPQHEAGLTAQKKNQRLPPVLNTIWFFEKELSRINANDTTPWYQVTVIDVYVPVPVSVGFGSAQAHCELGPILIDMGQKGWSLVCVLDTPKMQVSGMKGTVFIKAFFQRPVPVQQMVGNVPPAQGVLPAFDAPPPK